MCEKDVTVSKCYISWLYLGMPYFQLGVLQGKCSNVYFFIQYLFEYIRTVVFNKLDHSLLLVFVLDYHHCLYWKCLIYYMKIQWHCLLQLTRKELNVKKKQLNNSFCVNTWWTCTIFACRRKYYRWRSKGYVQSVCNPLMCFFYILNLEYPKKLETTFLLIQKLFLRISNKCKVLSEV